MSERDGETAPGGGYGAHVSGADPSAAEATGVTLYRPIFVSVLYLLNLVTGFTVLIGLILAYVWRNDEAATEWEETHFTYLIRTFWIGFWVAIIAGVLLLCGGIALSMEIPLAENLGPDAHGKAPLPIIAALLVAMLLGFLMFLWFCVRSILSLANAANRRPMPNPKTWLF